MRRSNVVWTLAITSLALFMVVLDNQVVSTALPVIRTDLGASIEELEWTVNAYTLTFAVFLLTGAALGGIALAPLALLRLRETYGTDKAHDLPGLAPHSSAGSCGLAHRCCRMRLVRSRTFAGSEHGLAAHDLRHVRGESRPPA